MAADWKVQLLGLMLLAGSCSFLFTWVARIVAPRLGLVDLPDGKRKTHSHAVAVTGGVALYASISVTLCIAATLRPRWLPSGPESMRLVFFMMLSAGLLCLLGFYDDCKALRPRTKLLWQIVASLPFAVWGRSIDTVEFLGAGFELGLFGVLFTTFWLVACTNIINLVDGLDGLAGTIGMIVCFAIAGHAALSSLITPSVVALLLASCLFGFLLHNWPPAKIFLGDSGSLLIGFMVGALSIESSMKTATSFAMAVPLILVSVPIFDTSMAIIRRKLSGRGIGTPDRRHIHHLLQDRGLSRKRTLIVISALCVGMVGVSLISAFSGSDVLALALCGTMLALLIVGRVFGYNETLLFFRYMRVMGLIIVDTSGLMQTRLFLARMHREERPTHGDFWDEVTGRVKQMGGYHLEFVCRDEAGDRTLVRRTWNSDDAPATRTASRKNASWQFNFSLPGEQALRATLVASGESRPEFKGQRLVNLFHLFESYCHTQVEELAATSPTLAITAAEVAAKTDESATVLTLPPQLPKIFPASRDEEEARERRVA